MDDGGSGKGTPGGVSPADRSKEPTFRVTDRRRFLSDGEPKPDEGKVDRPRPDPAETPAAAASPEREADRLDELTRAYAALVDDNRAFRQRLEREKDRLVAAERIKVAQALLEAHDELERAWNASRSAATEEPLTLRDLREGVRLTLQSLASRIAALGAERMEVRGKPFDPMTAEAVDLVTVADPAQDGLVMEEVRPGWRLGDRVLRPARVRVGRNARA